MQNGFSLPRSRTKVLRVGKKIHSKSIYNLKTKNRFAVCAKVAKPCILLHQGKKVLTVGLVLILMQKAISSSPTAYEDTPRGEKAFRKTNLPSYNPKFVFRSAQK